MPAPYKAALDYFPVHVDAHLDEDLSDLISSQGPRGELVYLKLLSLIYGNRGYYTEWTEKAQKNFLHRFPYLFGAGKFKKVQSQLSEIVIACIRAGLFDKLAYDKVNILTSSAIQHNWLRATYKRVGRSIVRDFWVNDIINLEETQLMTSETEQNKTKEKNIISIYYTRGCSDFMESYVDGPNGVLMVLPKAPPGSARPPHTKEPSTATEKQLSLDELVLVTKAKGEGFVEIVRKMVVKPDCDVWKEFEHFVVWVSGSWTLENRQSNTEADFARHFINWLMKQPSKTNSNENFRRSNSHSDRKSKFNETEVSIITDIADADGMLPPN